ncbi:DUF1254 domain-containing protein [Mesorhizobium sp.]|uniref:DUF1254 domain-containing protein n=1 Tax=Mesorhizobium sp. TaxID=1871066 RepID=UPI0025ED77BF|nr:DUF1254 domain-containing protein [Mesorhizobium sp.]
MIAEKFRVACMGGVVAALTLHAHAEVPTNGTLDTPIGQLEVVNGYPSDATVTKLYDEMDFQRAVQAYLWALPYVAMGQWQDEQLNKFGAANLDYVDYFDYKDKLGLLTANATTPYSMAFPNLEKTGPLVFEFPEGAIAGGILDFWQRPLTDTGQIGPDKGKGGKFLILGPNDPDMNPEGYFVFRSPTNNVWSGQRGLSADLAEAQAVIGKMRIYPYSERNNPESGKHIRPEGREWHGEQPRGLAYWELLSRLINEEPSLERDRMMLAMLIPLGIEKGKPFSPDERQKKILDAAADVGELMARANGYAKRFPGSVVWPDKKWEYSLFLKETNQEVPSHTQLDERSSWFYEAVGVTVGMMGRTVGAGQVYLEASKDGNDQWLDGGKHYTLNVPKDAPVAQFWSFTVYDNESRCLIDTGSYPDRSSRNDIVKNADGSVDLYFGPTPPEGKPESNWIKTLPGKGWFTYFRLYGPTETYFDKSWVLNDIQPI